MENLRHDIGGIDGRHLLRPYGHLFAGAKPVHIALKAVDLRVEAFQRLLEVKEDKEK